MARRKKKPAEVMKGPEMVLKAIQEGKPLIGIKGFVQVKPLEVNYGDENNFSIVPITIQGFTLEGKDVSLLVKPKGAERMLNIGIDSFIDSIQTAKSIVERRELVVAAKADFREIRSPNYQKHRQSRLVNYIKDNVVGKAQDEKSFWEEVGHILATEKEMSVETLQGKRINDECIRRIATLAVAVRYSLSIKEDELDHLR